MNEKESQMNNYDDIPNELDAFILSLGKEIEADEYGSEGDVSVINMQKQREMALAYQTLCKLTDGQQGVTVTAKPNYPFPSMGCVSVVGRTIRFTNGQLLARVFQLADISEFTSFVNGDTEVAFAFHNITQKLKREV